MVLPSFVFAPFDFAAASARLAQCAAVSGDVLPLQRSNLFWYFLIKHRLTHFVWRPLVEIIRRRHLHFRSRLMANDEAGGQVGAGAVISAGV